MHRKLWTNTFSGHRLVRAGGYFAAIQANMVHLTIVGLMIVQRRRRWANIKTTLVKRMVFAGSDRPA